MTQDNHQQQGFVFTRAGALLGFVSYVVLTLLVCFLI